MSMAAWRMLTWELLARQRWLFGLCAVYLALVALVCPVLPAEVRTHNLGWSLLILQIGPGLFVVAGLAHGFEGRLESRRSLFPGRLFILPVPSVVLAGPPLLLGTVVAVVG